MCAFTKQFLIYLPLVIVLISKYEKKTHRECRGGKRVKNNKRNSRYLPNIILTNVQSLNNKLDLLRVNCVSLAEYRKCYIICLIETWLDSTYPDNLLEIDGFSFARLDRTADSGKRKGGGLLMF